jgi:hypothetical protein
MYTFTRWDCASDLKGLKSLIRSTGDKVKAHSDAKKATVSSSEKVTEIAGELTLDDFGGRSDALGG